MKYRKAAQAPVKSEFAISPLPGHWSTGAYSVGSPRSRRQYTVIYHGEGSPYNSCQCMDFRTGDTGNCKHLEALEQWIRNNRIQTSPAPRRTVLDIDYRGGRRLRLRVCDATPAGLSIAAMRFFDDESHAVTGMVPELPSFIEQARRLDRSFHCTSDALNFILEERDRIRRGQLADGLTEEEIAAPLRTNLYPWQVEGIRLAFSAGRILLADGMGLGKTVQALGTAELLRARNMAQTVLVVCPTSLKYQWNREIERFTTAHATIIEGSAQTRRALYDTPATYRIVSYHTLANDIKVLGRVACDMMIMDEVQRLRNWNAQIAQAARRIESEYAVVISGMPLADGTEEFNAAMQFVDQYAVGTNTARHILRRDRADVEQQLPGHTEKTLCVPMTREQKEIHDEALATAAQLIHKWQRYRFMSEKDRRRLLSNISRMRMVCDSTYVLDTKTHFDTKVAETTQIVRNMAGNCDGKAVVFSQWERMTQLLSRELDTEGLAGRAVMLTDSSTSQIKLQDISLVINVDLPWDPDVRRRRLGRINQPNRLHVINLIAAGTIEEKILCHGHDGITDIGEDSITLDDSALSRIADSLGSIIGADDPAGKGAVADTDDDDRRDPVADIIAAMARIPEADRHAVADLLRTLADQLTKRS